MKAITYSKYGSPDVLQLTEVDVPNISNQEILIRVRAVEVTKSDIEMRAFKFAVKWFWLPLRFAFGVLRPRRKILGGYFSGQVTAIGTDVDNFSVGDEIYGCAKLRLGAYGQYMALPADYALVEKPQTMSFEAAAAVPLGGLNALHFMKLAKIKVGEKILINGAGGSIGAHSIQIAKNMGAEVTAVDSRIKESFLRRLGADHFIDYTQTNFTATDHRYDVIFDMVPSSSYSQCLNSLNPNGRYVLGNPKLSSMLRSIITKGFSDKAVRFAFAGETKEELLELTEMVDSGKLDSIVDRVLPMEKIVEAHTLVETEQRLGAIVISMNN